MPANRPNLRPAAGVLLMANPRRPLAALTIALLIVGLIVPVVSADEILYDEDILQFIDTSFTKSCYATTGPTSSVPAYLVFEDITAYPQLSYIVVDAPGNLGLTLDTGRNEFTYTFNGASRPGVVYKSIKTNALGVITGTKLTIFLNDWDITSLTGKQSFILPFLVNEQQPCGSGTIIGDSPIYLSNLPTTIKTFYTSTTYTVASSIPWINHISILQTSEYEGYDITLDRTISGEEFSSTINISKNDEILLTNYAHGTGFGVWYAATDIDRVEVYPPTGGPYTYNFAATPGDPNLNAPATIYVQSSQTGALLANAQISISAAAGDPPTLTEVVNATLPGGTGTYTLQPTGGGSPNPDYYRAVATVPGYSQIVENHSFTLNGPHDVIIEMRPDSGGPTDPENTYLEFYVRDLNANSIPAASIQCNNQIKTTNSAGYAIFEVGKNATYPYKVSKAGYVTIEGTATVADAPRYVANVVLGPGSVPTYTPTPGPGETPGATPTPDRRTNEEKGQSIIDMIADNAEPLAALALLGTFLGIFKLMAKW